VKRLLSRWTVLVVLGAIVLAVVSFVLPGQRHVALDVFVLYLGALCLLAAVRATHGASPDVHEPSLEDELVDPLDLPPERPTELERLEREVYLSLSNEFYFHQRMRPLLREIAAGRLLLHHGVDLDRQTAEAERLVGAEAWAWLRPDREEPRDRWVYGPPTEELTAVVDALERI
jgi:hypothetical protein